MSNKTKKLMILTYVWPPFAAVGVYRILKFCKYLRDFGVEPVIFTPDNPNTMSSDEGLNKLVPEGIPVYRSYSLEPFRWRKDTGKSDSKKPKENIEPPQKQSVPQEPSLLSKIKKSIRLHLTVPDNTYFWSWSGLYKGIVTAKEENVDIILSSSPPQSVHILGSRIARAVGCPHLADFRDLWTQNAKNLERPLPPHLERRNRKLEETVLKNAAAITVNTESFKEQLLSKNGYLEAKPIEVVTNGVDPDDFREMVRRENPNEKFTMVYTGSLYRQRGPEFFFIALQEWIRQRPEIGDKIKAVFIGNWAPEHADLLDKYDLGKIIDRRGWVPQDDALQATFDADLLLLFQGFDPNFAAAIPRKLGEYMITNVPIMAFALPGEITNLIEKYQSGVSFCSPEPEPIIAYLNKSFDEWERRKQNGEPSATGLRNMPDLETYGQVKKLAELCHRIG